MEETGGIGVDLLVDNGGERYSFTKQQNHEGCSFVNCFVVCFTAFGSRTVVVFAVRLFSSEEDIAIAGEDTSHYMPYKHEVIGCVGMAGRWVTSQPDLQVRTQCRVISILCPKTEPNGLWHTVLHEHWLFFQLDPPNCQQLFLRSASVSFLFEHAWMMSQSQHGRLQRILLK